MPAFYIQQHRKDGSIYCLLDDTRYPFTNTRQIAIKHYDGV